MRALPFYLSFVVPACFGLAVAYGGAFTWLVPAVVFIAIPLFDLLLGHDVDDPPAVKDGRQFAYDLALWLWVPVQLGSIALGLWRLTQGGTLVEGVGLVFSLALITGSGGINVAHEMMHRKPRLEQGLAEVLMTSVSYTWFCVEHVLGHHRNVATAADPATSRYGESLYAFVPRSMLGGLASAWRLETERVERRGVAWTLADRRVRHALLLIVAYALVGAVFGWLGMVFFALQGLVASALLETINYVEHYGLVRETGPDGRPVRVQPRHSWNSTFRVTNWYLFNLQRHSDHHAWASRPYHQLRAFVDDSPQLPLGYATMVLISFVPPLFFALMNPRVAQADAGAKAA
ncbi:MAG: alkane 1-monooxygenase [Myxococcota bacterium]